MLSRKEIEKLGKDLRKSFLLLGPFIRRSACKILIREQSPHTIPWLVYALTGNKQDVSRMAEDALRKLEAQEMRNILCYLWAVDRNEKLEAIIKESRYISEHPREMKVLSGLLSGLIYQLTDKESVPYLIQALSDKNETIRANALATLHILNEQEAIDVLCKTWASSRMPVLERIITEQGYIAGSPAETKMLSVLINGLKDESYDQFSPNLLYNAMSDKNKVIAANAELAMRTFRSEQSINTLCGLWLETRDPKLEKIIVDCRYMATNPVRLAVLSGLLSGMSELLANKEYIQYLIPALDDKHAVIAANAEATLLSLKKQADIDLLCEHVIHDKSERLTEIVRKKDYQPDAPGRRCLLYILTEQYDRYIDLDFDYQYLTYEYSNADEKLKAKIGDAIRNSGDARLLEVFRGTRRKIFSTTLNETDSLEILESFSISGQWEDLFSMIFLMPLKVVLYSLYALKNSGWQPDKPDAQALLQQLHELSEAAGPPPESIPEPEVSFGPVLEQWISNGRSQTYNDFDPDKLREKLGSENQEEAIAALSALALKNQLYPPDLQAVCHQPHWLMRLAVLALSENTPELLFASKPCHFEGCDFWLGQLTDVLIQSHLYKQKAIQFNLKSLAFLQEQLKTMKKDQRYYLSKILEILAAFNLRNAIMLG